MQCSPSASDERVKEFFEMIQERSYIPLYDLSVHFAKVKGNILLLVVYKIHEGVSTQVTFKNQN